MNNTAMHNLVDNAEFEFCVSDQQHDFTIADPTAKNESDNIHANTNEILAALPPEDLAYLVPHLKLVYVRFDECLFNYGQKVASIYLPTTAVIGLLYLLADGSTSEIAVVGHDGLLGISFLMDQTAIGTALVQSAGYAYKLKVPILKQLCERSSATRNIILRYMHTLFEQLAQNSACCRHLSIDRQLSHWLLNRLDRLPGNELKITQAMIAAMLGVRRESITAAAHRLQQASLIQYRRGSIKIVDRCGLEAYAGECYLAMKQASGFIRKLERE